MPTSAKPWCAGGNTRLGSTILGFNSWLRHLQSQVIGWVALQCSHLPSKALWSHHVDPGRPWSCIKLSKPGYAPVLGHWGVPDLALIVAFLFYLHFTQPGPAGQFTVTGTVLPWALPFLELCFWNLPCLENSLLSSLPIWILAPLQGHIKYPLPSKVFSDHPRSNWWSLWTPGETTAHAIDWALQ